MIQKIWLSKGCPYKCEFCCNGGQLIEFPIPKITSNKVQILDPAFLSKDNVLQVIKELGEKRVDDQVIHYELVQGINYKDLVPAIAKALKKNRFKKIRFAWDRKYNKNYMHKIHDTIKMLTKAGYDSRLLSCYMLVNWLVPFDECIKKLDLLKIWNVKVCDCCYDGGYHIKNWSNYMAEQKPRTWSYPSLKRFRAMCRRHNMMVRFGIDPYVK